MDVDSSPRTRKRGRSSDQHFNGSSPAAGTTPLSAVKRRKLDINGSSPSTPKALQVLKSAIGGVFNFRKANEKTNGTVALERDSQDSKETDKATAVFDKFIDELLAEEDHNQSISGDAPHLKGYVTNHTNSLRSGESQTKKSKSERERRRPQKYITSIDNEVIDDVDQLLLEEDKDDNTNDNQQYSKSPARRQRILSEDGKGPTKKSNLGWKRKGDQSSAGTAEAGTVHNELSVFIEASTDKNGGMAGARHADTSVKRNFKWYTQPQATKVVDGSITKRAASTSVGKDVVSESISRPGRERRRPRRYSSEMVEVMWPKPRVDTTPGKKLESQDASTPTKRPTPRSILTPSKKPQDRPRKNVSFGVDSPNLDDQSLDQQDTPVRDDMMETSVSTAKKRGRPKKTADTELPLEVTAHPEDGITEVKAGTENRRSPRQKVDAVSSKKLMRPKWRELSLGETSVEDEDDLSVSGGLRHVVKEVNVQSPEPLTRLKGRHAPLKKRSVSEKVDGYDPDDITCVICGGGESEAPNEILLCDNCDLAAHQLCYGVQAIPEGDWLCRDCRSDEDEELMLVETGTVSEPSLSIGASNIPDIEAFEYHLQVTQKLLLDKLTGRRRLKLYGLDEEYRKVYKVVEQTVLAGEGNSVLVIGARGCGKTALVESVMSELSKDHSEHFHVVRLNGFIHTDDKLALREIWRQLGREMEVDDDLISKTNNYADTLTSLLALLSHPSEISEVEDNQTAKSVVFILDEFDLFTSHPRQTLLYNLFDIAQARKAPIAVLGLTTKIDVVERLEKRVKSRFSHRYVHLPMPKNLGVFWEICRQGLVADMDELIEGGFTLGLNGQDEFRSFWESMINELYNKDEIFKQQLQTHFYRSKSVSAFLTSCILPIASLTPNSMPLTGSSFFSTLPTLSPPDSKLHLLQSLAELDLALLIAAARLNIILDTDNCNFAMAYDEYSNLTSKHKIQTSSTGVAALGAAAKVWGREVAIGAWERLVDCELLVPAAIGGASTASRRDGGRENKMWKVDVWLDEIPGSVEGLGGIMSKWCREI